MFTSEQHISQNLENAKKNAVSGFGTKLGKVKVVKRTVTYKEVTLAFGILIALLIAFTLWIQTPAEQSSLDYHIKTSIPFAAAKSIVKAATDVIL